MTGSTWESSTGIKGSEGRPRSDSSEPWDERGTSDSPAATNTAATTNGTTTNSHTTDNMRRDPYKYEEEELEDGDLPRLNLSRSTSTGNDRNPVMGRNLNPSTNPVLHENIRKMAGGSEELKKQQEFWKQLDSPSTRTHDEDDDTATDESGSARRKRRFEKEKAVAATAKSPTAATTAANQGVRPQSGAAAEEAREDTRNRQRTRKTENKHSKGAADPMAQLRRAESEESDDTRDSKEYLEGENEETNFCDHTLSAMEAICGDSGLQAFCGGAATTPSDTISNPSHARSQSSGNNRRKKAKNLNLLNARDETDSVDEHTAIEVEYVEPEETSGVAQERPENWSPTRKNAYLAAMARKAKEDFEKSQVKEVAPTSLAPRRQPNVTAEIPEASAQDVYNSFNAAEKRKFLRLINSGMTPTESSQRVNAEREKSKETKPAKKGKLFKFWKKGKSKNSSADTSMEKEKQAPTDRDRAGFPLESNFPQEEKKEDDQLPMAGPKLDQQKRVSNDSVSTSEEISGEASEDTPSPSHSQSAYEANEKDNGSGSTSNSPGKQASVKVDERSNNSRKALEVPGHDSVTPSGDLVQHRERSSPERSLAGSAANSAVVDITKPQEQPNNLSVSLDMSQDSGKDRAAFEFAKSGINYYDAVRRELSESEDETEFSNQVSVSSKSRTSRGSRLGPILQSPKLKGFSKLTKGGSKANRAMEKYASPQDAQHREELEQTAPVAHVSSPGPLDIGRDAREYEGQPSPEEEKSEIDADSTFDGHSRDYSYTQNVTEYGTANFDVPVRNSTDSQSLNTSSEGPSKAEEEALERIEKELLRPVRNAPTPTTSKTARSSVVTPDSSGRVPTPRSQKSAEKLRDQIVAVVSPQTVSSQASTPGMDKAATPAKEIALASSAVLPASVASTVLSTPGSGQLSQASHGSYPQSKPTLESLPSPTKLSPALASAARTSPASSQNTSQASAPAASKAPSLVPTQDELDLDMQEYLNSTEVYSQAGQVNDSMSIMSGKSFSTADTGHYGGSVYTQGSTLTQSSRKRRPGAAKTRLAKAKAAEKQALKKQGWHESIRAAAESTNRVWQPKVGWVDYAEESMESNTADLSTSMVSSTEKMHLNLPVGKSPKRQEDAHGNYPTEEDHSFLSEQDGSFLVPQFEEERELAPQVATTTGTPINNAKSSAEQAIPLQEENTAEKAGTPSMDTTYPESSPQQLSALSPHATSEMANVQLSQASPHDDPAGLPDEASPSPLETSDQEPVKARGNVANLVVDTSFPLDDSYLEVPPAPEQAYPPSVDAEYASSRTQEETLSVSLDDMSVEQSVAHSVDQFVQSMGAASPSRSGRKKAASSPHRTQRFSNSPTKRSGWVDSMRAATANIGKEGQSWDPATGWALPESPVPRSPLNEDFAPPSTRYEQETIEERQTEASDRLESDASNDSGADNPHTHEPKVTNPAHDERGVMPMPMRRNKMTEEMESTMAKKSTGIVSAFNNSPVPSPTEAGSGREHKREHEQATGGFPTVNVVKEKVDGDDFDWFPQTRRSSSMVVVEENSKEQINLAMQSSVASSSKSSTRSQPRVEESEPEGVVWNGVVFQTGSDFEPNSPASGAVDAAEASVPRSYPKPITPAARDSAIENKGEASRSGSSTISPKGSFAKLVPKLSQSKRDTSPIRAKAAQSKKGSRQDSHEDRKTADFPPSPPQAYFLETARTTSAPASVSTPNLENQRADTRKSSNTTPAPRAEGEQARASRSVWRNAASSASPSASPRRSGDAAKRQAPATNAVESSPRPDLAWPEHETEETQVHPDDRYLHPNEGAFPSAAMNAPPSPESTSSKNVRLRAQQWESKRPDEAGDEAEPSRAAGNSGRLNSATAEWQSFLGKKVSAESAAAADQTGNQRHHYSQQSDSLFDFSVADGSVDSRGPSYDGDGARRTQGKPMQHHQEDIPQRHAPNEESNGPPTEISDYSDGNEINKPFLARLAGCAAPMMKKGNQQGSDALAHLAFLRTHPNNEGKHGNSRFMPQYFCGRPDVILEEATEGAERDDPREEKKVTDRDEVPAARVAPQMKNVHAKQGSEVRADTRSVISEDFGAKTAYLEALAMKTAVSKPRKSDSRRRDRSSAASDVSSSSSKVQQKEKWRDFLERKSKTGASPGKSRTGGSDASASAAAENYAAKKVEEMMAMMASRSKSTPRSWRSPDDPDKRKSRLVENAIREHTADHRGGYDMNMQGQPSQNQQTKGNVHRSDSLVAAEQLASARVNAMMQALANDNATMEEGEI